MKYSNAYINEEVNAIRSSNNSISSNFPNLWLYSLSFPLELNVAVSLDNGVNYYKCNSTLKVLGFNDFQMYPVDFPKVSSKLSFGIASFPLIEYNNGDVLTAKLLSSKRDINTVEFNCTNQFKSCISDNSIVNSGNYSTEFYRNLMKIPVKFETQISLFGNSKSF
jgi:hypothetical protein